MNRNSPKDVQAFKEMVTYLTIHAKGRADGEFAAARRFFYRLAIRRFGEPDRANIIAVGAIKEIDQLEAIAERLVDFEIKTWDDLLREA